MTLVRPSLVVAMLTLAGGIMAQKSPFNATRMVGDRLHVQVNDETWYELVSLDGVATDDLIEGFKRLEGTSWWKRLNEDLPDRMTELGYEIGDEVDLVLVEVVGGKRVVMQDVRMTTEKRQRLWAQVTGGPGALVPTTLPPEKWKADISELRGLFDNNFSYRDLKGLDVDGEFESLQDRLGHGSVSRELFATELMAFVARFGDGHAGSNPARPMSGYLPFLVERDDRGYLAVRPDRIGYWDPDHPYLEGLDGKPLSYWLGLSARTVASGSPQLVDYRSRRALREFGRLRSEAGITHRAPATVRLSGPSGEVTSSADLTGTRPTYGIWPRKHTRMLEGEVGYLRIESMLSSRTFLDGLDAAMDGFRDSRALVVDVRGNGGGSREALLRLAPYFTDPDAPPRVASVGAYRLGPDDDRGDPEGFLSDRFMYPLNWSGWTAHERAVVESFLKGFEPEWSPTHEDFSAWHVMLLRTGSNPQAYHYQNPVFVLMDEGCFSASDVFLGGLKGLPGVTLVGTPSGGGSARSRSFRLRESRVQVRLGSMVSFRPDGHLYDGRGIQPDVLVYPAAEDFLGRGDRQLESALDLIPR